MSILASHLRGLIVSNLREDMNPRIKRAVMKLFNAVDGDLDDNGYNSEATNEEVDSAVEELETLLKSFNLPDDEDNTGLPVILPKEKESDLDATDDNNSTKFKGGDDEPEIS